MGQPGKLLQIKKDNSKNRVVAKLLQQPDFFIGEKLMMSLIFLPRQKFCKQIFHSRVKHIINNEILF